MSLEIYIKIEIERELHKLINEGKTIEDAAVCLVDSSDPDYINYIIEACMMPIDEITCEINRYDSSNPKLDEIKFINDLCRKYNVDRKSIIERIQNVRSINRQNEFDTPKRLEYLKRKRDSLQKGKDKLSDKSMNPEEKSMYYFGLGVVTVVGGFLFYQSSPVLAGLIPVTYAASLPTIRLSSMYKKEFELVNELVDLNKEIEILDKKISENKEETVILDKDFQYINAALDSNIMSDANLNEIEDKESLVEGPRLVKRRK